MSKISTQKKSDSREVEIKKLTGINDKLKSQNLKLQEESLKLKKTIFSLKENIGTLKTQVTQKGRRLEDLIEESLNETNK